MTVDNRLLAKVPPEDWARLSRQVELVDLPRHSVLIEPNTPIRSVWFPTTALASLVTVLEDGSTVESGSVGREGMVGVPVILGAESTPMETVTQIPGRAYRFAASTIRDMFAEGGVLHATLNKYVHTLFVVASQSAACNRKHDIEARLARWLLASSDGVDSRDVAITHEYLAAMLGVRRPGVTEAALKLQEGGMIEYSRGGVTIVDRQALVDAACECYRRVKDEYERLLA